MASGNPYITSPDEALARLEARGEYFNGEEWASKEEHQGRDIPLLIAALRHFRAEAERYRKNWLSLQNATGEQCHLRALEVIWEIPHLRDEAERLRTALKAIVEWLMVDPSGQLLDDSVCWNEPFRKALKTARAALAPQDAGKEDE